MHGNRLLEETDILSPFRESKHSSVMYVELVDPHAVPPARQSEGSAGYDLTSVEDVVDLQSGDRVCVSTGLKIIVPQGCYGRIAPRSGLAVKNGIDVGAGVIDSDYRGIVKVLLYNLSKEPFSIPSGSRIAQLILEKIATPCVVVEKLPEGSKRGDGGFGSTGI